MRYFLAELKHNQEQYLKSLLSFHFQFLSQVFWPNWSNLPPVYLWLLASPRLENPSEGPLADVSDVLDIIPGILEGQQL